MEDISVCIWWPRWVKLGMFITQPDSTLWVSRCIGCFWVNHAWVSETDSSISWNQGFIRMDDWQSATQQQIRLPTFGGASQQSCPLKTFLVLLLTKCFLFPSPCKTQIKWIHLSLPPCRQNYAVFLGAPMVLQLPHYSAIMYLHAHFLAFGFQHLKANLTPFCMSLMSVE